MTKLFEPIIDGQPNTLRNSRHPLKIRLAIGLVSLFAQMAATPWCSFWEHAMLLMPFSRLSEAVVDSSSYEESNNLSRSLQLVHHLPCEPRAHHQSLSHALTRLSVLLEEVCFAEPLEEQSFYQAHTTDRADTDAIFLAARRWLDQVKLEMGTRYWYAVTECLSLSLKADQEREQLVWQDFHEKVLLPLHTLWQNMEATPV